MKELYYDRGQYRLATHKVTYKDGGETIEQFTDSPGWFPAFREMHGGMDDLAIEEISYSDSQISRLEEVRDFSPSAEEEVYNYVMIGDLSTDNPAFRKKMDEQRLEALEMLMVDILGGGF